jgi:hypothetical protein
MPDPSALAAAAGSTTPVTPAAPAADPSVAAAAPTGPDYMAKDQPPATTAADPFRAEFDKMHKPEPAPKPTGDGDSGDADPTQADAKGAAAKAAADAPADGAAARFDPEEAGKAYKALARDGTLSEKQLRRFMQEEPAEFIRAGLKAAKRQADVDGFMGEYKTLKETAGKPVAAETPAAKAPEPTPAFAEADLDAMIEPFADVFGEDAKAPLRALAEGLTRAQSAQIEQLRTAHTQEVEGLRSQLGYVMRHVEQQQLAETRRELTAEFEDLADDAQFGAVHKEMVALSRIPEFVEEGMKGLMTRAARQVFGTNIVQRYQQKLAKGAAMRDNGQPASTTTRQAPPKVKSFDEIGMEAMRELGKGADPDALARRLQTA